MTGRDRAYKLWIALGVATSVTCVAAVLGTAEAQPVDPALKQECIQAGEANPIVRADMLHPGNKYGTKNPQKVIIRARYSAMPDECRALFERDSEVGKQEIQNPRTGKWQLASEGAISHNGQFNQNAYTALSVIKTTRPQHASWYYHCAPGRRITHARVTVDNFLNDTPDNLDSVVSTTTRLEKVHGAC